MSSVAKGWCTEIGNDVCDDAIQVFGGMGFVEETGIAQLFRDARIITIYEGTTGIQGNDLISRKILREKGETLRELMVDLRETCRLLCDENLLRPIGLVLSDMVDALASATDWVLANGRESLTAVMAGAVPFLHMLGNLVGGWQLARTALAAQRQLAAKQGDTVYLNSLIDLAAFYMTTFGVQVVAQAKTVCETGVALEPFPLDGF